MTTWTYGGTDLTTFGNITKLDDNFDVSDRRGGNITIPFKHGAIHTAKYYDERTIQFGIAMVTASATALDALFDTLLTLISVENQVLSWTRNDASVRTASASVNKSIQVNRLDNRSARVVLDFTLASPFFRLSTAISDNTTIIDGSPHAMVVTNPGSAPETDPVITLTGPLLNTVITNSTNGAVLTYTGTIASPRIVTIQTVNGEYTATDDLAADKIGNVSHSGGASLLPLNVGANTLSITDGTATTGTVKVSFYAPFI